MQLTRLRPVRIPEQSKRELMGFSRVRRCTLNGKPAVVVGVKRRFAKVMTLDNKQDAEFAWPTVEYILKNKHGEFHS